MRGQAEPDGKAASKRELGKHHEVLRLRGRLVGGRRPACENLTPVF
jgi:hypothetical protein